MDDVWLIIFLSLCMLVGCYVAGSIPLAVTLSEDKLRHVVVLGAGLLVGTALAVIIPEGVHIMYSKQLHAHHNHANANAAAAAASETRHLLENTAAEEGVAHTHAEHTSHIELHTWIGVSLVLGFTFMLLVDQLSGGGAHSHGPPATSSGGESGVTIIQGRRKMTLTIGLVVHAAADGVALGAAATMSQVHVQLIVFIAIMLHKLSLPYLLTVREAYSSGRGRREQHVVICRAPAAFGLVSFLLHDGFDRTRIRKHLAVFSAAAPLLALVTYFGLSQQGKETLSDVNATGIAMLFSAGTFLYVATVHVLPEVAGPRPAQVTTSGEGGTIVVREHSGFNRTELLLMVGGSLLPLILSLSHHH